MKYHKVVTEDLKSLGLRKNPNILLFPIGKSVNLAPEEIETGKGDWGGIWVAVNKSGAMGLKRYMKKKYNQDTRVFEVEVGSIIFQNSYRAKTDKVKLIKEV